MAIRTLVNDFGVGADEEVLGGRSIAGGGIAASAAELGGETLKTDHCGSCGGITKGEGWEEMRRGGTREREK
jgi:hypothetical protein